MQIDQTEFPLHNCLRNYSMHSDCYKWTIGKWGVIIGLWSLETCKNTSAMIAVRINAAIINESGLLTLSPQRPIRQDLWAVIALDQQTGTKGEHQLWSWACKWNKWRFIACSCPKWMYNKVKLSNVHLKATGAIKVTQVKSCSNSNSCTAEHVSWGNKHIQLIRSFSCVSLKFLPCEEWVKRGGAGMHTNKKTERRSLDFILK